MNCVHQDECLLPSGCAVLSDCTSSLVKALNSFICMQSTYYLEHPVNTFCLEVLCLLREERGKLIGKTWEHRKSEMWLQSIIFPNVGLRLIAARGKKEGSLHHLFPVEKSWLAVGFDFSTGGGTAASASAKSSKLWPMSHPWPMYDSYLALCTSQLSNRFTSRAWKNDQGTASLTILRSAPLKSDFPKLWPLPDWESHS